MNRRFNPQPKPKSRRPAARSTSGTRPATGKRQPKPGTHKKKQLTSKPGYVRCQFMLTLGEYGILQICMRERGLAPSSYNAALQTILAEWKAFRDQPHHPVLMAVPVDMLPGRRAGSEER